MIKTMIMMIMIILTIEVIVTMTILIKLKTNNNSFIHGAAIGARPVRRWQRVVGLLAGLRVLTHRPSPPSCGSRNVSLSAPASLQ